MSGVGYGAIGGAASALASPWVTYAASQTGASLDVQNAIVAGVATLSGGVAAGLAGANAQAGATWAENEALNNTLQHRDQVIAAIKKTLAANPTLASKYSVDTLEHAAENVYGGNGGMGVWKNEADAQAATAKGGTTYYQNAQGLYVEEWKVPAGAEDVAQNIVDNAFYEYGPSFAAVTKDNLSQLMSTYLKTFGSDPSQFQGAAELAGGGALFGIGATKNVNDILAPNGDFVGSVSRGATPNIRTVSSTDFSALKADLLNGATASGTYAGGKGTWYDLPSGGRVGVRTSDNSGVTLDIDIPGYPKGFKVHQQ